VRRIPALVPTLVLCAALPAAAQVLTLTPQFSGNSVTASIQLPGGVEADLSIIFEQVVGLNSNALAITAATVDPKDPSLLSRFPDSLLVTLPASFPVLVRIEPAPSSALSFSGVYTLSLHTHNLTLTANSPLRLYRSPGGGAFQDMTGFLQSGSTRAGGSGPGFSEFLIAADTRPTDGVIAGKFDTLQSLLSSNGASMNAAVASDLQQRLTQARGLYAQGAIGPAINAVSGFADTVKQQSGANIPDVWRANASSVNVAGLLRSAADTLKFSLAAKSNGAP
jgi:hypothetical protein